MRLRSRRPDDHQVHTVTDGASPRHAADLAAQYLQATVAADASRENEDVRRTVDARIKQELIPRGVRRGTVTTSDWAIHDYSSCFSVEWTEAGGRVGIFVKIPKTDIDRRTVSPRTGGDRLLAEHEFATLTYLRTHWDGSAGVTYVEPLAFYRDYGAIVTRRAYAADFFPSFRRADIARKLRAARRDDVADNVVSRLGAALREFHRRSRAAEGFGDKRFGGAALVEKVTAIVEDLRGYGVPERLLRGPLGRLERWQAYAGKSAFTFTLKGLDIRNVLIDGERHVHLLDPGRLKPNFHEADLARMLMTCRILYWGTPWFFLHVRPAEMYERAFLRSYYQGPPHDPVILRLHLIKELFKHWRSAYVALTRKRWPGAFESLTSRTYIDAFYSRAVARELARMSS